MCWIESVEMHLLGCRFKSGGKCRLIYNYFTHCIVVESSFIEFSIDYPHSESATFLSVAMEGPMMDIDCD